MADTIEIQDISQYVDYEGPIKLTVSTVATCRVAERCSAKSDCPVYKGRVKRTGVSRQVTFGRRLDGYSMLEKAAKNAYEGVKPLTSNLFKQLRPRLTTYDMQGQFQHELHNNRCPIEVTITGISGVYNTNRYQSMVAEINSRKNSR